MTPWQPFVFRSTARLRAVVDAKQCYLEREPVAFNQGQFWDYTAQRFLSVNRGENQCHWKARKTWKRARYGFLPRTQLYMQMNVLMGLCV